MVIQSLKKLQCLDVLFTSHDEIPKLLLISANLQELTIRIPSKGKRGSLVVDILSWFLYTTNWLEKWTMLGFLPCVLNVVSSEGMHASSCITRWLDLNSNSPDEFTSCFRFYTHYKLPMDLFPALPMFQLEFGQSSSLPIVKASSYGLLGLEDDLLLLTSRNFVGKAVHKATLVPFSRFGIGNQVNSDVTSLNFVAHFDACHCNQFIVVI